MTRRDLQLIWLIARRELWDQMRDWRILAPLITLTIFFPFLMNFVAGQAVNFVSGYGADLIGERLVPFFLMVVGFFPITVALVGSLETFVGEKERGTIEPLLNSPLQDWHLYMGKLLSGTVLPLSASYLGISVYLGGLIWQGIPLPGWYMLLQTLALTAAQAVLMVTAAMTLSAQATTVKAANLMASFIILPMAFLIQGESILMFWGNDQTLWLAVIGVSILAVLITRVGLAHFQREQFLGREFDSINLRGILQNIWARIVGQARSLPDWWGREIPATLWQLRTAILVTIAMGVLTAVLGYVYTLSLLPGISQAPPTRETLDELLASMPLNAHAFGQDWETVSFLLLQNTRAVIIMFFLGLVSFSVLGMLLYIINIAFIAIVFAGIEYVGLNTLQVFVAGVLPHGVFEIPALIIAAATILNTGVLLVTPDHKRTIGQVFVEGISLFLKLFLGVVLPFLILAALIESFVTPFLLQTIF
jgi:uncharacterized membrane protein SpoIIM required for sporulation